MSKVRLTENFRYNCSGLDFTSPYLKKYVYYCNEIYHKVYVAIYICCTTTAINLDKITD